MTKLEFFYDCSSPWTYIAFHHIQLMARKINISITWRPILVGAIFNRVNVDVYATRSAPPVPQKAIYLTKDIQDWAQFFGLIINRPPKCGHPVNSVKCMRACLALQPEDKLTDFSRAAFEALWVEGQNLGHDDVITQLCKQVNVDPGWLFGRIESLEIKEKLRANTEELINRGGFGSPTMFVDEEDMYFGNDRITLVEAAVLRKRG